MTITAKIIADSVGENSKRLTTFQLKYPRFIHAELMTHRVFSRNASSSRAIPVEKTISDIMEDCAMPIHWGKNQKGMQAYVENDSGVIVDHMSLADGDEDTYYNTPQAAWLAARDRAVEVARGFVRADYHKQVVNRILEPYMHISVVVTATNFDNFYWLRRHAHAQPEIKVLADAMWTAQEASTPRKLQPGEWHLPYVTDEERDHTEFINLGHGDVDERPFFTTEELIQMSVARCARVSYLTHDGKVPDFDADLRLYERLVGSEPLHASPAEHQATPTQDVDSALHGNLDRGWIQFRQTLKGQYVTHYEPSNG
jgi:thymidylate synthase ThyX